MNGFRIYWKQTILSGGLVALVILTLILFTPALAPIGAKKYGPFTPRIIDGDTFANGDLVFRIAGVDACEKGQPATFPDLQEPINCGEFASAFVARFISDNEVVCYDQGQRTYGRIVARCFLNNGWPTTKNDIGAFALKAGWAFPTDHATISYALAYQVIYFKARLKRNGFWNGHVEKPEIWRHR